MAINWRRGALRLWVLMGTLWCGLIVIFMPGELSVRWSFAPAPLVHVKFSDTETWDYPVDWGEERIKADLEKRIDDLNRKEREWLATLPETQKTECAAILSTIPFANQPKDCARIFFSKHVHLEVPTGWENQVSSPLQSIWWALGIIALWAAGPPILVMALGLAIIWAMRGFAAK